MAQERLSMRKIRELLRLKFDLGLSIHKIAASLSIARSTVTECLRRAAAAGISWPLPQEFDDGQLEARLYPKKPPAPNVPMPDFAHLQRELSRPGVTRLLLWQEYKAQHPEGLQYSAFCDHFRAFLNTREPVMRFEHRAGEKCFVDYAGQTGGSHRSYEWRDPSSADLRRGARLLELHLCRGELDTDTPRLAWRPRAGPRVLRRRAGRVRSGQLEERGG